MPHFLQDVLDALKVYSSRPLIKLLSGSKEGKPSWRTVRYGEFLQDIEKVAGYWAKHLEVVDVKPNDVVGIWVTGEQYHDLVYLYGLSRAGYTPQMLNKGMSVGGSAVVIDVLAATGAKAILFDSFYKDYVSTMPLVGFEFLDVASIPPLERVLPQLPDADENDIAIIFHTSGTTSGRPKPIPETQKWVINQSTLGWAQRYQGKEEVVVVNNIGSFANVGSATAVTYISRNGQCLIQTPRPDFDEVEFLAMIDEGLRFVLLYAPWLSKLVSNAKSNKEVYSALKKVAQVTYTGAALNPEDEQWLIKNGIPLTVMYACTETAACLTSLITEPEHLPSMRPLKNVKCTLIPIDPPKEELDGENEKRAGGGKFFDLLIPADAPNCPHPTVRNRPTGHITGDLFEETAPGFYAFRGRTDDWIRTGKQLIFCDTKGIEDNILREAADLVKNSVVVGHYKPGIVLIVEPAVPEPEDEEKLKADILSRHAKYNDRLFFHEQLRSTLQVILAAQGTLPRTVEKGNIRRKATEEQNSKSLEDIYAKLKTW
ncbi:acetyl-CoA synthetase-like protein [Crepidotus variabilis]|uniref:Acetyl-CoA synthetase-like protein n=1 Tax=Crepidotus variabilis TaxID=179855 RepID=A0A9P6EM54_9AGAR|nr:acetyl-CoA synthetase-like protein [Crepidotus variabilis]